MEPSPSPESALDRTEVDTVFALADLGVRAGLAGQPAPKVDPETLAPVLRAPHGVFVTLEVDGQLNGCIGSIVPAEPLGAAVAELAWRSAFDDYPSLEFKLSLISPLEPVPAGSEPELLANVEAGVDGVLIRHGEVSGTFLPAVWEKLPDPLTFLRHLEAKAGLRPGDWPAGMQAWRYRSTEYRRRAVDIQRRPAA